MQEGIRSPSGRGDETPPESTRSHQDVRAAGGWCRAWQLVRYADHHAALQDLQEFDRRSPRRSPASNLPGISRSSEGAPRRVRLRQILRVGNVSGPTASSMPGCHSRKASGVLGATTTGSAVNAPRLRSVLARCRASYSPLIGQQKARRLRASPGNDRSRLPSICLRQASSTAGVTRSRSEMSRSRCVLRQF